MEEDSLQRRGDALESAFFSKVDKELLDKMRESVEKEEAGTRLRSSTGIKDDKLIEDLLVLGVTDATMSALALFPLVWVAWADDRMESREKEAILKAAEQSNIDEGTPAMALLNAWLSERPTEEVIEAWSDHAHHLKTIATPETVERVKRTVVVRAQEVAEAAGGFMGVGTISPKEQEVLERLELAFR